MIKQVNYKNYSLSFWTHNLTLRRGSLQLPQIPSSRKDSTGPLIISFNYSAFEGRLFAKRFVLNGPEGKNQRYSK